MELQFNLPRKKAADKGRRDFDFIIIGAGAAGLSAAVYASRSGLDTIVLEKSIAGGLTLESPLVENYLGFSSVQGTELAAKFVEHASKYVPITENVEVESVSSGKDGITLQTTGGVYTCRALGITTGTSHKKLGVPGEGKYSGNGLSYCSTCDGYLFRDKDVVVIGGGNSGTLAAISTSEYAGSTTVISSRSNYVCEDAYVEMIKERRIPYIMNARVIEIEGDGRKVTGVLYRDIEHDRPIKIRADGVFVYIGLIPRTRFLSDSGLKLTEDGYIITDDRCRTSVERIYAAGDVISGSDAQIATAVGEGCRMALTVYGDLVRSGWRGKALRNLAGSSGLK